MLFNLIKISLQISINYNNFEGTTFNINVDFNP